MSLLGPSSTLRNGTILKAIFKNERYGNSGPKYLHRICIYSYVPRDIGELWVESICLPFENAQSWPPLKEEEFDGPVAHWLKDAQLKHLKELKHDRRCYYIRLHVRQVIFPPIAEGDQLRAV